MQLAAKEAENSGRVLTKGQRKELAKELAAKMAAEQREAAALKAKQAKAAKEKADKLYWEEIDRKNRACYSKSLPKITLADALSECNGHSGTPSSDPFPLLIDAD